MQGTTRVNLPHDVPFDERLFESNHLLKDQYKTAVAGRNVQSSLTVQRAAEEDDLKNATLRVFDSFVETKQQVPYAESQAELEALKQLQSAEAEAQLLEETLLAPEANGPVLQPLTASGVAWWVWLIVGLVAGFIVLVAVQAYSGRRFVIRGGDVEAPKPVAGGLGLASKYEF